MPAVKNNVIRLYDVKPEMALEHLKRSTGLEFDDVPQNLAGLVEPLEAPEQVPPVLTDIVENVVYSKA
jgi:hypothetical protein